jgi:O-antigen/teichoic acid export membrane protein
LYGEYVLALLVPNLFLLFTDLGVNTGITKFTASLRVEGKNDKIPRIILYGLTFRALVGLVAFAIDFAFADNFAAMINRPDIGLYIRIVSVSILFQAVATSANAAFIGMDKTEYSALTTNVMAIAKTVSSIGLVLLGFGVAGAAMGFTGGYIVATTIALPVLFFKIIKPHGKRSKGGFMETLKTLATYGAPLYISVLLAGFAPLFYQAVLAYSVSNSDIGNYSVASNFLVLLSVIPGSITTALLPAFSKLDSSSAESIKSFFRRANKYSCLLVVPMVVLLAMLSKQVVEIVYGSAFQLASYFLLIGCLPYLLVGIGYLTLASLFNGLGDTRTTLKIILVGFVIGIVLSPIMASAYGVPGLILTSLFSNAIAMLYGSYIVRIKFKVYFEAWTTAKIYLTSAASAIPPLLLIQFIPMSNFAALLTGGILYILLYVTLIPLTRIIGPYELRAAMQIVQKIRFLGPVAKPVLKLQERILRMRTKPTS